MEEGEKKKEAQVLAFCGGGKSKNTRGEGRARACWIAHVEKGAAACLFGAEKQKKIRVRREVCRQRENERELLLPRGLLSTTERE